MQVSDTNSSLDKLEDSSRTLWYKPTFNFNNMFSLFKTPNNTNNVSLTMDEQERYHHLEEDFSYRDEKAHLDRENNRERLENVRHMENK